ncbi:putative F-box protein At3g28280 [Rosa rugosa]|uniref:putative F-box protein At3g28280 n=1 Tax=Rosa rugosa TaxID=74645 RepID=UPI002B4015E1|nr:putative F-box protein At3g28280 [Rosa rugosa]XP_062029795.1 putative F-box protein At3g28280 [Rosa rugosa]XP_062029796.1 putative F-box protein At3g28280 [Rosa rugosa]
MMAKSIGSKKGGLLRLVEERSLSKKTEEEKKHPQETQIPYLPEDCISSILVRLPIESLQRSSFVCKPWFSIIKSPKFINAHLNRSESVLIFLSPIREERSYSFSMASVPEENPNTVSVESKLLPPNCIPIFSNSSLNSTKFSVQFLAIKNGKTEIGGYSLNCLGSIRATCNGLILLDNKVKKGGLIVLNPVTRKLIALPLGTLHRPYNESYGFALSDVTGEYKIVHLFRDDGFVSCEILSLRKKAWRGVNGPAFGPFGWFGYTPVSAIGALHWIPQVDRSDYIVSVEVHKEKFHQIRLPKSCRTHDRIIEMGGALGFVIHEEINRIDVWILKGFCGEVWTKNHSITVGSIIDMIPYFSLRIKGDIIFKRDEDGSLYAYDFQQEDLTKVEMVEECIPTSSATCLPHVNSLVSWMDESSDVHD